MKIGTPAEKPAPAVANANGAGNAGEAAKASAPAPAASATKPEASAKIELSSATSTLLASGSTPEFDAEKVARITQSINDGTYKVNPEVIADKLIANASELLSRARH